MTTPKKAKKGKEPEREPVPFEQVVKRLWAAKPMPKKRTKK